MTNMIFPSTDAETLEIKPIVRLLSTLSGVIPTLPNHWLAYCPVHGGAYPSLLVIELPDGRMVMNCPAQCGAIAIFDALGLEGESFYPKADKSVSLTVRESLEPWAQGSSPIFKRATPDEALAMLTEEMVTMIAICKAVLEKKATDAQLFYTQIIRERFYYATYLTGINRV